jgi:hypothetical protein
MEMPMWIAVMLAIVLGIPSVRAFPASYVPPTGHTVTSSFRFAKIPYTDSVRHIHTLEHLESISAGEYFKIQRVHQPTRYGRFVTLTTDCAIQGVNHTICLLSRPDLNNTCTYMCLQGSVLRAQVQLQVRPSNNKLGEGHVLTMETTYYSGRRVLDRNIAPTVRFLSFFEEIVKNRPLKRRALNQHPNLQWYRRIVLGLCTAKEDADEETDWL